MPSAYVYIHFEEGPIVAGVLEAVGEGREATARFTYGRRYLQREDRFSLDPVQLPLSDQPQTMFTPEGFPLFNGLRDSAPDWWGRTLMERAAGGRTLTEFDYLVATGEERVGALAFGSGLDGPHRMTAWPEQKSLRGEHLDLEGLLAEVEDVDSLDDLTHAHREFLLRGSSLGGARPKAPTEFEGRPWLAKFSRRNDSLPMCALEYCTMKLATIAGLSIPRVRLEKVMDQDIYLIERFDRPQTEFGQSKLPFISGLTLLGAHESELTRYSYRQMAEQLRVFGSQPAEDQLELFKRMVFNILCNNTDDHLRNHGFLWDGRGWRLSPGYDIVATPEQSLERRLSIGVGSFGRSATLRNALTEAASFGLDKGQAAQLIFSMQQNVKHHWEAEARAAGLGPFLPRLSNCFLACEEPFPPAAE